MNQSDIWAVLVKVRLEQKTSPEHRRQILDEYLVPKYEELPGFLLASWFNDGQGTGVCWVEFDSEQHAKDALAAITAGGGPEVVEFGVYALEHDRLTDPTKLAAAQCHHIR